MSPYNILWNDDLFQDELTRAKHLLTALAPPVADKGFQILVIRRGFCLSAAWTHKAIGMAAMWAGGLLLALPLLRLEHEADHATSLMAF